jgi:hypothetical protein
MPNDDELQDAYSAYDNLTATMLEQFPAEAIAGVMAVQALTLYKTILSDSDYESIVSMLYESRDRVKPMARPTLQ